MADDGRSHSLQFDEINVKIRASIEPGTLDALHWDCFATLRKMAEFHSARSRILRPPQWSIIAPQLTGPVWNLNRA